MNNYGRRDDRKRFVNPNQRLSSAQNPFNTGGAVRVNLAANPPFDLAQATKYACRSANLSLLKTHLFDNNVPQIALAAEVSAQRMAFFLDCDANVEPEMAEHMEKSIGLPAGWLDTRRQTLTEEEVAALKEQIANFKREEEIEPPAPRVHLIRPAPAAPVASDTSLAPAAESISAASTETSPQSGNAQVSQESESISPTQSRPSNAGFENNVHKEIKVIQLAPELEWLNAELEKTPRGTRSLIARSMGRNPNDLSAWLNGLRVMPSAARTGLLRAVHEYNQELGEEAMRRFGTTPDAVLSGASGSVAAAAPAAVSAPVVAPVQAAAPVAQPVATPAAAPVAAKPTLQSVSRGTEVKAKNAGTSTYLSFRSARNVVEIDAIAMRTAQTLAEVMGSVMRRMEQNTGAEEQAKDTVSQG